MECKVGDKVRIKSMDWFLDNTEYGIDSFVSDLCGMEATIIKKVDSAYYLNIGPSGVCWFRNCFEPIEKNKKYTVKAEDLVGEIKDFPIEVVQKMVERQVEQSGKPNVSVFQKSAFSGFLWQDTIEGHDFWNSVINLHDFDLFFEKYPKKEIDTHVYYRGNAERGEEIISELEKLGGKNDYGIYNGKDNEEYYFINPKDHLIRHISTEPKNFSEHLPLDFLKSFYTEKFLPENKQEIIEIDGKKYNKQEIIDRIKELKEVE